MLSLDTCLSLQKAVLWAPGVLCSPKWKPWKNSDLWEKSPKSTQSPILDAEADALGFGSFFKAMQAHWVTDWGPSPGMRLSFPRAPTQALLSCFPLAIIAAGKADGLHPADGPQKFSEILIFQNFIYFPPPHHLYWRRRTTLGVLLFFCCLGFGFLSFGMLSYCMALCKACSTGQRNTMRWWWMWC